MADWITPEEVAGWLDLVYPAENEEENLRLELSTAAVKAAVERRRDDLDFDVLVSDEIHGAAIKWAALYFQSRSAPSGFTGYGDETQVYASLGTQRAEILNGLGWRRPLTA